jgi:hypothetical protein
LGIAPNRVARHGPAHAPAKIYCRIEAHFSKLIARKTAAMNHPAK